MKSPHATADHKPVVLHIGRAHKGFPVSLDAVARCWSSIYWLAHMDVFLIFLLPAKFSIFRAIKND